MGIHGQGTAAEGEVVSESFKAMGVLNPYMGLELGVLRFLEASAQLLLKEVALEPLHRSRLAHELDLIRYELRR